MTGLAQMIQNDWDEQKNGDIVEADSKKVNEILRGLYYSYPTDWQVGNHKKASNKNDINQLGSSDVIIEWKSFKSTVLLHWEARQGRPMEG